MARFSYRAVALLAFALLSACVQPKAPPAPEIVPGYEGVQDGNFFIDAVNPRYLPAERRRTEVAYNGPEEAGSVIVDPYARRLYYILGGGRAIRYSVAVGRAGLGFKGDANIRRKAHWPSWTPTDNMVRTMPELYADYAGGLPGGLENPLGARAMYLYRNGKDTYYRIHGTRENNSIGRATSAGCIRLFNQDAIDLYNRVQMGAYVHVRSAAESERIEGRFMNDAEGYAIPYDPNYVAQVAKNPAAPAADPMQVFENNPEEVIIMY